MQRNNLALLSALFIFSASLSGTTINWGVDFSAATFSDGTTIPTGFTFELGTFGAGFEPDGNNTSQWNAHFLTTGIDDGNAITWANQGNSLFPAVGEALGSSILRTEGDVAQGDRVYLWGYNSKGHVTGSEWILLTNEAWFFPAGTSMGEIPGSEVDFLATDPGTVAVFGKNFNLAGNEDLLARSWQTEAIPEPASYALIVGVGLVGLLGIRRRLTSGS